MGHVRITPLDGKIPNLALMRLAAWHKSRGDEVHFVNEVKRSLLEPEYDKVYASAIFSTTAKKVALFRQHFPDAIIGGSGSGSRITVEEVIGEDAPYAVDYLDWTEKAKRRRKDPATGKERTVAVEQPWSSSVGFTQRGCRLKCGFCLVPKKEGKNRSMMSIYDIWRGEGYPKNILLLDNDFFGQEYWRDRVREIREGNFKVAFSQGLNIRLIDDEAAAALATLEYRDGRFQERRIYTAWDNIGDEKVFFDGIDRLERAGIKPNDVMAYMLTGYDRRETLDDGTPNWERIFHRFDRMVARGIEPFVMVYNPLDKARKKFQRWANMGLYRIVPWKDYDASFKTSKAEAMRDQLGLFDMDGPGLGDTPSGWTPEEDAILARVSHEMGPGDNAIPFMAEAVARTQPEVRERLVQLGIRQAIAA